MVLDNYPDLTSTDVVRLSGATFRQLDYWTRTGVLVPRRESRGSGTQRRWTPRQAAAAGVVRTLSDAGAPRAAMEAAVEALERDPILWGGWLLVAGRTVVGRDRWGRVERRWEGAAMPFVGEPAEGWLVDAAGAAAVVAAGIAVADEPAA